MPFEHGMQITVRDAKMAKRNFEGRATKFKEAGPDARGFLLILTKEMYDEFLAGGLNVKEMPARPEYDEDEPLRYLPVAIGYKIKPPRVVLVTSKGKVNLGEDAVAVVDWVDIDKVDLIFNVAHWKGTGDKGGIKCWLKTIFITINEDELEAEYGINDVSSAALEDVSQYGQPAGESEGSEPF